MSLLQRFAQHIQAGRLMDLVGDLEKSKIRVTIVGDSFKIDGPPGLVTPELGQLLQNHHKELSLVIRMATLATDQFGSTRLYHAVLNRELDEVRRHLQNGARPDAENRFGVSSFHAAIGISEAPIIEALAIAGASLDKADIDGRSPLHLAVEAGDLDILQFLLVNGAKPNPSDFFGFTPLARAVSVDDKEMGELLVEFGAEMQDPSLPQSERDFRQLVLRMLSGYSDALYHHSVRVADIARCIARNYEISDDDMRSLRFGALLHDLGKVSLPDDIFDKADDVLTDDEVDLLMGHPVDGAEALPREVVPQGLDVHSIILSHHEKWDGGGFPQGLEGEDIPFLAQVVGLADYYDHLVTHRPYDPAISHEQALEHLNQQADLHFSGDLLDGLFQVQDMLPFYHEKR